MKNTPYGDKESSAKEKTGLVKTNEQQKWKLLMESVTQHFVVRHQMTTSSGSCHLFDVCVVEESQMLYKIMKCVTEAEISVDLS